MKFCLLHNDYKNRALTPLYYRKRQSAIFIYSLVWKQAYLMIVISSIR